MWRAFVARFCLPPCPPLSQLRHRLARNPPTLAVQGSARLCLWQRQRARLPFVWLRHCLPPPTDACCPSPACCLAAPAQADSNPNKINLGVGAYRDDNGKPFVLESVKKVRRAEKL